MTDRERLRELAEKASPGPWRQGYREGKYVYASVDDFLTGPIRTENAAYIAAASPDVILALLADLEAAEKRVRVLAEEVGTEDREDIAADILQASTGGPDFTPKEWPE